MREMLARAAYLPNAFVRLAPDSFEVVEQRQLKFPPGFNMRQPADTRLV